MTAYYSNVTRVVLLNVDLPRDQSSSVKTTKWS